MVTICEVGPRDGLQNEEKLLSTETKIHFINQLSETGVSKIECVSFVNPKVIRQMADAIEVMKQINRKETVQYGGLVLSESGLDRALNSNVNFLNVAVASSEEFNLKNSKRTVDVTVKELENVVKAGVSSNIEMIGIVGTAFGCPYEGKIEKNKVLQIADKLLTAGCKEITLADTTGMANPLQVRSLIKDFYNEFGTTTRLALHFHNTRGLGLANTLAGFEAGVKRFDSSIGGLGGCPFAPKAVGNVCTEDLINMLYEMNVDTSIDLNQYIDIALWIENEIGHKLDGMVMKAGTC